MNNMDIENRLAAIRTAASYLKDAEKQLEAILFDRVPAGRIRSSLVYVDDYVVAATFNLEKAR